MRLLHPAWRAQWEDTGYPFADGVSRTNAAGFEIPAATFIDGAIHPVGGQAGLYLAQVDIAFDAVTLTVGDPATPALATAAFSMVHPPELLSFADEFGRAAGVLVSSAERLAVFQSWPVGVYVFAPDQTEFAASICFPTPETGVRGVLLDDGTLLTGNVWLVGEDGVVLREVDVTPAQSCAAGPARVVRVDVVGDPLFRRRLCAPPALFSTPRFVRTIRVVASNGTFECGPNARGDLQISVGNNEAADTILRVRTVEEGVLFEAAGSPFA